MKKIIYISAFIFLGFLVQFIIHGVVETGIISLLIYDFDTYNLGLEWREWVMIHYIGTILLSALGIAVGFWQGRYWWRRIYSEENH